MTTEEKRQKIIAKCNEYGGCVGCKNEFNNDSYCGHHNTMSASPEIIDAWYEDLFGETPIIKDSGERRQFFDKDGNALAVRDMASGKGRMDLLPWAAIMEVSKHCENGALKYGEHNVDKGLPVSSFCDSAARHLAKWMDGWTDEPHLLAAVWNLLWAVQMELKHPELCDIPWKGVDDERKAD